jgi:hypothetical protein
MFTSHLYISPLVHDVKLTRVLWSAGLLHLLGEVCGQRWSPAAPLRALLPQGLCRQMAQDKCIVPTLQNWDRRCPDDYSPSHWLWAPPQRQQGRKRYWITTVALSRLPWCIVREQLASYVWFPEEQHVNYIVGERLCDRSTSPYMVQRVIAWLKNVSLLWMCLL